MFKGIKSLSQTQILKIPVSLQPEGVRLSHPTVFSLKYLISTSMG